jgi:glycosyltransferase involved in cell wall biosynthesis
MHTTIIEYPEFLLRKAVQKAAFIAGISHEVCGFAAKMHPKEVHLVRNGLNFNDFPERTSVPARSEKILLAVGGLIEKKGFDILLEACGLLRRRGLAFTSRIIGEGPERPRLKGLIRALGLEQIVRLTGAQPFAKVKEEFSQATVFVMPCRETPDDKDGLPTVLIESMALGVPVVATRMAGNPELVIHGVNGFLAEPNNPHSLAQWIEELLLNEELRNTFSVSGRKKVEEEYDIKQTATLLEDLMKTSR